MAGYKEPTFKERAEAAAKAREKALARLNAKPPIDQAEVDRRIAAQAERDAAKARKRAAAEAAKQAELAEAERLRAEQLAAAAAEAAAAAPPKPVMTEAERKAARDAKFAARKSRKASR